MANPFAALFRGRAEHRSADATDAFTQAMLYGGSSSASGVSVTPESALASVAVSACIEVRAETFSALPGGVFRRADGTREQLNEHDVARLLFDRPNDLMTGGELQRWTSIRKDLTGNAYHRIVWRNGRPAELWPMYGTNPEVYVSGGKIAYRYAGDDVTPAGTYAPAEVLHFKGPFLKNPLEAASPIKLIKDTIGLSIATEQFFGRFLNNGSHFPAYLETDSALTPDDVKAVQTSLRGTSGVFNAGAIRVFDRGLKVKQNQMSLKDADLTAQMRWYLEQVCRIYRVPLPLVQDWTHGTYTNSEQAGLWFAQHTITPIAVDYERTVGKLFLPGEADHYVKFNVDAILRGDYATRTAGYQTLILSGVMNRNEARALEDLNPYDGGDEYLVPLNMAPAGQTQDPAPATQQRDATALLDPILTDVIDRVRLRAVQDAERGRPAEVTRAWAVENVLPPIVQAMRQAGVSFDVDEFVARAVTPATD